MRRNYASQTLLNKTVNFNMHNMVIKHKQWIQYDLNEMEEI